MDSRLKRLSILGCIASVILLIMLVIYANGGIKKQGKSESPAPENTQETQVTEEVKSSAQIGDNLK